MKCFLKKEAKIVLITSLLYELCCWNFKRHFCIVFFYTFRSEKEIMRIEKIGCFISHQRQYLLKLN